MALLLLTPSPAQPKTTIPPLLLPRRPSPIVTDNLKRKVQVVCRSAVDDGGKNLHKPLTEAQKPLLKKSKTSRIKQESSVMDLCARMCGKLVLSEVQKGSNKNIVVSPLSFHAILNVLAAGATGSTLQQLLSFLGCSSVDNMKSKFSKTMAVASGDGDSPVVSFVNGVWVDKRFPLTNSYREFVRRFCNGLVKNVDFATQGDEIVKEANLWAENETRGLISEVLTPSDIDPSTICLLGNALYFKGAWREKFDQQCTKKMDFYLLDGRKVSAPFMTGCEDYLYGSFDDFQVVKIPYRTVSYRADSKEFAMYILLPNKKDGLKTLLQKVDSDPGFLTQDFKLLGKKLDSFWIPKFKFSYSAEQGKETMIKMGLTQPFSEECRELTEMVKVGEADIPIYLSEVVQKAFIEVDEEGTEAAAVTFGIMTGSARRNKITTFVADHPFMFLIREENSRSVFFAGAVLNPCSESDNPESLEPKRNERKYLGGGKEKHVLWKQYF